MRIHAQKPSACTPLPIPGFPMTTWNPRVPLPMSCLTFLLTHSDLQASNFLATMESLILDTVPFLSLMGKGSFFFKDSISLEATHMSFPIWMLTTTFSRTGGWEVHSPSCLRGAELSMQSQSNVRVMAIPSLWLLDLAWWEWIFAPLSCST